MYKMHTTILQGLFFNQNLKPFAFNSFNQSSAQFENLWHATLVCMQNVNFNFNQIYHNKALYVKMSVNHLWQKKMKRKDDVDIIISVLMQLMHLFFNGNYSAYILNNLPRKYQMLNIGARESFYIHIFLFRNSISILILKYQKNYIQIFSIPDLQPCNIFLVWQFSMHKLFNFVFIKYKQKQTCTYFKLSAII